MDPNTNNLDSHQPREDMSPMPTASAADLGPDAHSETGEPARVTPEVSPPQSQPALTISARPVVSPQVDGFSPPAVQPRAAVSAPAVGVPSAAPADSFSSQTTPQSSVGSLNITIGGGDMTSPTSVTSTTSAVPLGTPAKSGSKKWLKVSLAVVLPLLLLGGGAAGAYFGYYMNPNTIWKDGMNNTGMGFTQLSSYLTNLHAHPAGKGTKLTGDFQFDNSSTKIDGTISTLSDGKNSNSTLAVNAGIAKITLNARSFAVPKDVNPDIYVQVTGFKDLLGDSSVAKLDGKWVTVNHTFLDDIEKQDNSANPLDSLTSKDVDALVTSVSNTTSKYVFTGNKDNSVMVVNEKVGQETQDGHSVYHYKVTFDKNHVKSYVEALHDDLQNSQIGKQLAASSGQSFDKWLDYSDLLKSVDNIKSDYKADVWVDTHTRLIHKVRFTDPNNSKNYFDVGQNYTGGTNYPFLLAAHTEDPGHGTTDFSLGAAVDQKTNKLTLNLKVNTTGGGPSDNGTLTASLTMTPNNDPVTVSVPQNAESLSKVLRDLGLSSDVFNFSSQHGKAQDADRQSTMAMTKEKLYEYQADSGYFPVSQQAFLTWLASPNGGNDKSLSASFTVANGYNYAVTPRGCDNKTVKCTAFTISTKLSTGNTLQQSSSSSSSEIEL